MMVGLGMRVVSEKRCSDLGKYCCSRNVFTGLKEHLFDA